MNRNLFQVVVISYLLLVASAVTAGAVGLQVKPSEINLEAQVLEKTSIRIQVFNPASEVSVFDVYPDSFESQIKTSPASFVLESGESREVLISLDFEETGQFNTNLSVVARPISKNSFNAGGGLKIPVSVTVVDQKDSLLASVFNFFGENQSSLVGFLALMTVVVFLALGIKFLFTKRETN